MYSRKLGLVKVDPIMPVIYENTAMPNPMNKHVAKLRQFTGGRVPFSVSLVELIISVLFVESQGLESGQ